MKKLCLLLFIVFVYCVGITRTVTGALAASPTVTTETGAVTVSSRPSTTNHILRLQKYNATLLNEQPPQYYYDNSEITCSVRLPQWSKKLSPPAIIWQLTAKHGRVLARGHVNWQLGKKTVTIPLRFAKLKPGIKLKCILQIKLNKKILVKQPIEIYSKQIFADIAGMLKKLGAGAVLPEHEITRLNKLGMGLPRKALNGFENPLNQVIFCAAKEYADNIYMLKKLIQRGVTLVMFAPDDATQIFLPLKKIAKITIISANNTKSNGGLGVIYSKEKIMIDCDNGQGDLVKIKYQTGKIIIVANAVYKNLDKTPTAALMLKQAVSSE